MVNESELEIALHLLGKLKEANSSQEMMGIPMKHRLRMRRYPDEHRGQRAVKQGKGTDQPNGG